MSMMDVGARESFAAPAPLGDGSEFFDTLYCLTPQDLAACPPPGMALLSAVQGFIVEGLADLFPYWRQPVTDRLALAAVAFAAVELKRRCAASLPGARLFDVIGGAVDAVAVLAQRCGVIEAQATLSLYADMFERAAAIGGEAERLLRSALLDLLIDPAHLRDHGLRIALLARVAVERMQREFVTDAAGRLILVAPRAATNCDKFAPASTKLRDLWER